MKRDRTRTWNGVLLILVIASLLCSCTKEPIVGEKHPGNEFPPGMICIDFSGSDSQRIGTSAYELQNEQEKDIQEVDIFFYSTTKGNLNLLVKHVSTGDVNVFLTGSKILVPTEGLNRSEKYLIQVVANGGGERFTDLVVGSSIDKLSERLTSIDDIRWLKTPLLMSGQSYFIFMHEPIVDINLIRQVVKLNVTVKLSEGFISSYPGVEFGGMRNSQVPKSDISLFKLPSHSFMVNRSETVLPQDSKMLNSENQKLPWNPDNLEWTFSTYAYENPVRGDDPTSKDGSTQFILQMPYQLRFTNLVVTDNYYKVYINDAKSERDPHKTVRNHLYDIRVTINGFGSDTPDYPSGLDMTVTTNVLPWNVVDKAPEMGGGYVKDPRATFTDYGGTEAPLAEGGNLPEDGGTVKIYCKTNVGGWYVIVRDHGKIVQNTKSTPTPAVNTETEQSLDIAIPAIDYLDGRYTVSIHHPAYASELINQIPPITFTQYGGFIPNSELLKEIEVNLRIEGIDNLVKIGPWPADKLPPRGLQIAKIGNVLPTEVAQTRDLTVKWGPMGEVTGITEARMSFGKSNYAELNDKDATLYPIGQACKHLGPEWYVPSFHELLLIHQNDITNNKLGLSYQYTFGGHWSTTEDASNTVCAMVGGFSWVHGGGAKDNTYMVRCVRNI